VVVRGCRDAASFQMLESGAVLPTDEVGEFKNKEQNAYLPQQGRHSRGRIAMALIAAPKTAEIVTAERAGSGMKDREPRESRGKGDWFYKHDQVLMKTIARKLQLCVPQASKRAAGQYATEGAEVWSGKWAEALAFAQKRLDDHCKAAAKDGNPRSGRPGRKGGGIAAFNPFESESDSESEEEEEDDSSSSEEEEDEDEEDDSSSSEEEEDE
jgi:hypothetical protein